MKKIIKTLVLSVIFICSVISLGFAAKLASELYNSPQLLIHITDPFPSYFIQDKMVARWECYCIVAIVFLSFISLISLSCLLHSLVITLNEKIRNEEKLIARKQKAITEKQQQLELLKAELEELKKDE